MCSKINKKNKDINSGFKKNITVSVKMGSRSKNNLIIKYFFQMWILVSSFVCSNTNDYYVVFIL